MAVPSAERPRGIDGYLSARVKQVRLRQAARFLEGGTRLLDLGCGYGEAAALRPELDYVGVERDAFMAAEARRQVGDDRVVIGDLESPEFSPGGCFDRILMLAVWEHLVDPSDLLRRSLGWTEPGGRLVVTTPAPLAHLPLELGARVGLLSRHADEEHERLWSLAELTASGVRLGWRIHASGRFLLGLNQIAVFERPR